MISIEYEYQKIFWEKKRKKIAFAALSLLFSIHSLSAEKITFGLNVTDNTKNEHSALSIAFDQGKEGISKFIWSRKSEHIDKVSLDVFTKDLDDLVFVFSYDENTLDLKKPIPCRLPGNNTQNLSDIEYYKDGTTLSSIDFKINKDDGGKTMPHSRTKCDTA